MPDTTAKIRQYSHADRVPILIDNEIKVWESMSIMEYANEKFPEKKMWPVDSKKRAHARSIANEMHSGFQTLREVMPHHLKRSYTKFDWSKAKKDIGRVKEIWTECLEKNGGPFLFGDFSIADAMYAPVVNRFVTYGIPLEPTIEKYVKTMRSLPAHQKWISGAMKENFEAKLHEDKLGEFTVVTT